MKKLQEVAKKASDLKPLMKNIAGKNKKVTILARPYLKIIDNDYSEILTVIDIFFKESFK